MKKPIKAKPEPKWATPKLKPYCAIQFTAATGCRSWFATRKEAVAGARMLLEGKRSHDGDKYLNKLAVVKLETVVVRSSMVRKAKATDTLASGGIVGELREGFYPLMREASLSDFHPGNLRIDRGRVVRV